MSEGQIALFKYEDRKANESSGGRRGGRGIAREGRGSRCGRVLTGLDENLHGSCGEQRCAREVLTTPRSSVHVTKKKKRGKVKSSDFPILPRIPRNSFRSRISLPNRESCTIVSMILVEALFV